MLDHPATVEVARLNVSSSHVMRNNKCLFFRDDLLYGKTQLVWILIWKRTLIYLVEVHIEIFAHFQFQMLWF
jgi:hypothetical protein